jgi:hypothetical protein
MTGKVRHYFFIGIAIVGGYFISSFLVNTLFIGAGPIPAWGVFQSKMLIAQEQVAASLEGVSHTLASLKPTGKQVPAPTVIPQVANSNPAPVGGFDFFDTAPAPTAPLAPTTTPRPTSPPRPTPIPPTLAVPATIAPSQAQEPTSPPVKPTKAPKPTKEPAPTNAPPVVDFPKVSGDPLKQPWYGSKSLACYTTERMIEVYANGLTPNSCYNNVHAHLDANIVSTTLLGRTIQVHKKALAAFEAVSKTLDQYKVDSTTYKFPSKTYKIKNVGAYIFRCNVNASTSAKGDTCSSGCKLSPHAFGIGVDINYDENCNGCKNYDMPKEISDTFEMYGFRWGGHYPLLGSLIDPMHFEYMRDLCDGV